MLCPNDNAEMQQVKTESYYCQTVILDQCSKCGGIWFDNFELYMPKQGEADKIELLNVPNLLSSSSIQSGSLLCPRDRTHLLRFNDPFFPKDLVLARCQVCNGFWLNRGEFRKYQQYRQTRQEINKPREMVVEDNKYERDLLKVLQEHKSERTLEALGKLGRFLSIPIDSVTWRPLEPETISDKEKSALDMILTAVSLILRFFIRI
jgi:Zn-finger nucleic acid-binding protein